ncbi:MAG: hypothetical protein L0H63_15180, partial [Nitrococcus sp.]|nr:hypothetical protein [Nitrococcus sp.]
MQQSAERLPNTPALGGKGNSLDRIRVLLRVAAATLGYPAGSGPIPYVQSGVAFVLTGAALELEQRARASRSPVVVADVEAVEALTRDKPRFVNETPIRFLAILPMGSGDNSPVQLLTLVDSRPRSIDTANRLAMIAIETFYPANPENPEAAAVRLRRDL